MKSVNLNYRPPSFHSIMTPDKITRMFNMIPPCKDIDKDSRVYFEKSGEWKVSFNTENDADKAMEYLATEAHFREYFSYKPMFL